MAGWLAGLPVVTGPILFFLAIEQGPAFTATAASAALSAALGSVSFSLAYAHVAQRQPWPLALLAGLASWAAAALLLSILPVSVPLVSLGIALATLLIAPGLFPVLSVPPGARAIGLIEMACRMLAGALLTLSVTMASNTLGQAWSGLLAVFPVLGLVLAVFSHRAQGAADAAVTLRAMVGGLYAFAAFCFTLSQALPVLGNTLAFLVATTTALAAQVATRQRIRPSDRLTPEIS